MIMKKESANWKLKQQKIGASLQSMIMNDDTQSSTKTRAIGLSLSLSFSSRVIF